MSPPVAKILFPNRVDESTLSGGAWISALPLANLKTRVLQRVARSADVQPASTQFRMQLARARNIDAVVLLNHSISPAGQWRVLASMNPDMSSPVYDSGTIEAFPPQNPTLLLSWNDPNWWSGKADSEQLAGQTLNSIHVLPRTVFATYWQVQISDPSNPAGYLDVGRVFLSSAYRPDHNYDFGATLGIEDLSSNVRSLGGTLYFDERKRYRVQSVQFTNLRIEGFPAVYDLALRAGQTREVFWIPDETDLLNQYRTCFLARIREPTRLEAAAFQSIGVPFVLEELL